MPGSGKQPPEIQEQIKELLEAGFDPTTIHRRLKVGRSSIYRMKRCLQQHGTNYMPPELNKKNGRPKVLSPDQELEVRDWLRDTKNRTRYLDDLVWLIHDRFSIVCSTTTMSKMKRKWLRVIEYEEHGVPIDDLTRTQLMETHPDLPLLSDPNAFQPPQPLDAQQQQPSQQQQQQQQQLQIQPPPLHHAIPDVPALPTIHHHPPPPPSMMDPQLESQLEQQIHGELGVGPAADHHSHGQHIPV